MTNDQSICSNLHEIWNVYFSFIIRQTLVQYLRNMLKISWKTSFAGGGGGIITIEKNIYISLFM